MPENTKHTIPDGTPLIDALAEELFGSLAIEPTWFELPEEETLAAEGDSVTTTVLMFGERGAHEKRVRVRLVIEDVEDLTT